jgi:hypothetical protein
VNKRYEMKKIKEKTDEKESVIYHYYVFGGGSIVVQPCGVQSVF